MSIYQPAVRLGVIVASLAAALAVSGCDDLRDQLFGRPEPKPQPIRVVTAVVSTPNVLKPPPPAETVRATLTAPRPVRKPEMLPVSLGVPGVIEPMAVERVEVVLLPPVVTPIEPVERSEPIANSIEVVGLTEEETVTLLGEPAWRTWRPPSRVLRYASQDCAVDIYFYLDVKKDMFQALQMRAPDAKLDDAALKSCLGKVRDEHRIR